MEFEFTSHGLTNGERSLERLFRILPGATSWTILLGLPLLAWFLPQWALLLTVAFHVFWILYLLFALTLLTFSFRHLRMESDPQRISQPDAMEEPGSKAAPQPGFSGRSHPRAADQASSSKPPHADDIHHVVIVPLENESGNTLGRLIDDLRHQDFPPQRTVIILALEESAPRKLKKDVWNLHREHYDHFMALNVAPHHAENPLDAECGALRVDNLNYAARMAAELISDRGIDSAHVIVTCLDSRAAPSPDHLSCLTATFLSCPERQRSSFQPVPLHDGDLSKAPAIARVLAIGASLFELLDASNPEKLLAFSSHSMSLATLVEINYWPTGMSSDDSSIFWKSYLHFAGDFRVVPLPFMLSCSVCAEGSPQISLLSLYREKRHRASGIRNFPVVLRGLLKLESISMSSRIKHGVFLLVRHVSVATWGFVAFVMGWLPGIFASIRYPSSTVGYLAPRLQLVFLSVVLIALLITLIVNIRHRRRISGKNPPHIGIRHALEFLLLAPSAFLLSAIPELAAQTRMMIRNRPSK